MKVEIFKGYNYTEVMNEINEWLEQNLPKVNILFIGQSESNSTSTSNNSLTITIWYIKARYT